MYTPKQRLGRYRRDIVVQGVRFGIDAIGNYQHVLTEPTLVDRVVCMFNDNTYQWEKAGLHPRVQPFAGGGNACARP
eukprot:5461627-Prymnesium_polylepis.1